MVLLQAFIYLIIILGLALFSRTGLIYFTLLTGALPIFLIHDRWLADDFGSSDINSIRIVGIWLAAMIFLMTDSRKFVKYLVDFRYHLLFLLFCGISLFWSPNLNYGFRMISKLSAPLLFLIMVLMTVTTNKQLIWMERMIFIGSIAALIIALITWNFKIGGSAVGLSIPTFGPSLSSAFFMIVAMMALVKTKYEHKWCYFFLLLFLVTAIFCSFTRITIVALFIGGSLILFMSVKGLFRIILPVSGLLGVPILFFLNETLRKRMFISDAKISLENIINNPSVLSQNLRGSGRFHAWDLVMNHFVKPSPVIGSGLGATQNFFYSGTVGHMGAVHSEYVRLIADVGAVGLILFAVAFLIYLFKMIRIYHLERIMESGRYAVTAAGAIVAYLIYLATDNGIDYVSALGVYVISLIGMSLKSKEQEVKSSADEVKFQEMTNVSFPDRRPDLFSTRRFPIVG
jgi:hypothetical protein